MTKRQWREEEWIGNRAIQTAPYTLPTSADFERLNTLTRLLEEEAARTAARTEVVYAQVTGGHAWLIAALHGAEGRFVLRAMISPAGLNSTLSRDDAPLAPYLLYPREDHQHPYALADAPGIIADAYEFDIEISRVTEKIAGLTFTSWQPMPRTSHCNFMVPVYGEEDPDFRQAQAQGIQALPRHSTDQLIAQAEEVMAHAKEVTEYAKEVTDYAKALTDRQRHARNRLTLSLLALASGLALRWMPQTPPAPVSAKLLLTTLAAVLMLALGTTTFRRDRHPPEDRTFGVFALTFTVVTLAYAAWPHQWGG